MQQVPDPPYDQIHLTRPAIRFTLRPDPPHPTCDRLRPTTRSTLPTCDRIHLTTRPTSLAQNADQILLTTRSTLRPDPPHSAHGYAQVQRECMWVQLHMQKRACTRTCRSPFTRLKHSRCQVRRDCSPAAALGDMAADTCSRTLQTLPAGALEVLVARS